MQNDLFPQIDIDVNGEYYKKETKETGVIYRIFNIMTDKSYEDQEVNVIINTSKWTIRIQASD